MVKIDKLVRSKRKTLSVSVNALGEVTLRAPLRASQEDIDAFLSKHEAWVLRMQRRKLASGITLPTENLEGYTLLLLGEEYTLTLHAGERVALDAEHKRLYLPEKNAKKRLVDWIKENALRICQQVTKRKALEMHVNVTSVSITSARSFWGICTAQNEIRFSYRLLYVPKDVFEYVVVHELSHVKHKNHSTAFWREVERYVPNWKMKRKWLKDKALLMQVF